MSSNIVQFAGAGLPAVTSLATSLRNIQADVGPSGVIILKMDKTGAWVFGAEQDEVQEGSKWAVNPFSFIHGYIAWGEGEVLGEKMTGIANPLPEVDAAPPGAKKGWEVQVGMSLKCISGEDTGMDARFTTTSVGGKRAVQQLAVSLAEQVEKDQTKVVPIVMLDNDSYKHATYGKIFTPIFRLVEFVAMTQDAPTATEAEAPKAEEAPKRRRRSAVAE